MCFTETSIRTQYRQKDWKMMMMMMMMMIIIIIIIRRKSKKVAAKDRTAVKINY